MSRELKKGLDFFLLDTVLNTDMELLEAEFGLKGFAVVIKLWQKIYAEDGYYCEWTDEVALLFAKKVGVNGNVVSEIIKASFKRGIFDKEMYDKYKILTSTGVQKRYFEAVSRRKQINVKADYLLIPNIKKMENVNINSINVNTNTENDNIYSQSKEENKREENSIVDNSNRSTAVAAIVASYQQNIGMLSPKVAEQLTSWLYTVDVSLILYAIDQAVENGVRKPVYIYSILQNQYACGITTREQAEAAKVERQSKQSTGKKNTFQDYGSDGYETDLAITLQELGVGDNNENKM